MAQRISGVTVDLSGHRELARKLEALSSAVRKRIARKAVRAGAAPVVKAARQLVPIDKTADPSGTLKRSITQIERRYNRVAISIVGAARSKSRTVTRRGRRGKKTEFAVPANYAHLVEFGHVVANIGTVKGVSKVGKEERRQFRKQGLTAIEVRPELQYVPPRPFLRIAFESTKAIQFEKLRQKIEVELAAEAAKGNT